MSEHELELGFEIATLPTTEFQWSGCFAGICAKKIKDSCYVMKFDEPTGVDYYVFAWGVATDHLPAAWIPCPGRFSDPEMAIHAAELDMWDHYQIRIHPLPTGESSTPRP